MAKYPDWVRKVWQRADTSDFVHAQRQGRVASLEAWLTALAPGTFVEFQCGRSWVDYRAPSTESTIGPAVDAYDAARHLVTRLGLDLRVGVVPRLDVWQPALYQPQLRVPEVSWIGQVSNAVYTRRANAFRQQGYKIQQDPRLPADFVKAVDKLPSLSPAWYTKLRSEPEKIVSHYAWVLDWRQPGCVEWTREWILELCRQFRPDFIGLPTKLGWHMAGSPALVQPGERTGGGDFSPSFYGEGEYEALLQQQAHWLLDQGYAVCVVERPGADPHRVTFGSWADERIRSEVVAWQ